MKTKKTVWTLGMLLFLGATISINAQDKYGAEPDKCKTNLSLFSEAAKVKNYAAAKEPWQWCYDNCPKSSTAIYVYGVKMAEDAFNKAAGILPGKAKESETIIKVGREYFDISKSNKAEMDKIAQQVDDIYTQRIKHFPSNLGKVYSDWANFIFKRLAVGNKENPQLKEELYSKLSKSFKADPTGMSVKNLGKYFQELTDRHKDSEPQLVFDTYDEITEAVGTKMDKYSKTLDKLNAKEEAGQNLSGRELKSKKAAEINLTALGQVEGYLDNTLSEIATCDRLIPLYKGNFEKNKSNVVWLKRAVSRLNAKECTSDPLYPEMVEAYVNAAPSSDAYVFYAGILLDRNEENKALEYFTKAIDLESDSYKKAGLYYKAARITAARGQKSKARDYCYKALKERPSLGAAYLLISNMYASSANSCGTDEISKRMVYVAAADKARKAKAVDPGITATANKYIKSYMASAPSKKLIFTEGLKSGTSHKIGCWINETARIP